MGQRRLRRHRDADPAVAEQLADSADLAAGSLVLDVAGGTGNAAIAAARCGCDVTCTDYVPALLERGRERARPSGSASSSRSPTPRRCRTGRLLRRRAVRLRRDVRSRPAAGRGRAGARVPSRRADRPRQLDARGLPRRWFRTTAAHVPPPAGVASPLRWGTEEGITELLGDGVGSIRTRRRTFTWRFRTRRVREHPARLVRPDREGLRGRRPEGAAALERDLLALIERSARPRGGAIAVPAEYLEVVAVRR